MVFPDHGVHYSNTLTAHTAANALNMPRSIGAIDLTSLVKLTTVSSNLKHTSGEKKKSLFLLKHLGHTLINKSVFHTIC